MLDGVRQVCHRKVCIGLLEPWAGAQASHFGEWTAIPGRSDGPIAS